MHQSKSHRVRRRFGLRACEVRTGSVDVVRVSGLGSCLIVKSAFEYAALCYPG